MAALNESVTYEKEIYNITSIQKAAYRNLNSISVNIVSKELLYVCEISPNLETSPQEFEQAIQEFKKDVLDYQLRYQLDNETKATKNLILGLVFSKTGLT